MMKTIEMILPSTTSQFSAQNAAICVPARGCRVTMKCSATTAAATANEAYRNPGAGTSCCRRDTARRSDAPDQLIRSLFANYCCRVRDSRHHSTRARLCHATDAYACKVRITGIAV